MQQLRNRLNDIYIDPEEPFANDALDRKKYAEILTSVVDSYSFSGCVLAVNGRWGTGKTTFVKMWQAFLAKNGYKTLFFNAWESDYMDDPLVALVSEVRELNADDSKFKEVAKNVGKIIMASSAAALESILKNKLGIDSNAVNAAIREVNDIGNKCLEDYAEQKKTFENFRKDLQAYIADNSTDKPVVFFVDELDRCRPDYSVKVLERIKHLFDIPNIVFILSMNKQQLGYAIQGFYGTPNLDVDDYLRRFIDVEYAMPQPNMENFINFLYTQYRFDDFLCDKERLQYFRGDDESGEFRRIATKFAEICNLDLRTLDRIFAISRITLQEMNPNNYLLPDVLFVLCLMKIKYPVIYSGIVRKTYTVQGLLSAIEDNILNGYQANSNSNSYDRQLEYTIAILLVNYNNPYYSNIVDTSFVGMVIGNENQKEFPFHSTKLDHEKLNEAINWCMNNSQEKLHMGLNFSTDRIDLLNNLRIN